MGTPARTARPPPFPPGHPDDLSASISVAHWAARPGPVSIASVRDDELYRQYETINVYRRGPGATLELNRPDRMNAWSNQFSRDLLVAIREVADDNGIRAVVVTGAGKAFSSGADLKEAAEQAEGSTIDVHRVLTERYHPIITGIRRMPKPVVAAVNGPAVGIGLSLALACDLVVAAESAYFALAFVNIGLAPDGGSSLFVPSRVGFARAAELAMLGERLDARKALDWGLINRVWPDAEFASKVATLLDQLASGPRSRTGVPSASWTGGCTSRWKTSSSLKRGSNKRSPSRAISPKGSRRSPKSGRPGSPAPEPHRRPRACGLSELTR